MKKKDEQTIDILLPGTSAADLMGRQSVRATFKLTEHAISAISIVATHLGIKQKSLFDHLIEDMQSLELIARELHTHQLSQRYRIQKTYVLSRRTLSALERACKEFNTPRDVLVEYSIKRLLPVIAREREKHARRKKIFEELEAFVKQGGELLEKAGALLGRDDPVYDKIQKAMIACQNTKLSVEDFIEKGSIIEEFDIE